jgi:hypothetical protein
MVKSELHASADLPPESTSHTHSVGGSVRDQEQVSALGWGEKSHASAGNQTRYVGCKVRSLVTMPAQLSWLRYSDIAVESFNSYCI